MPGKRGAAYEAETEGVIIRVKPSFLEEESSPAENRYIWAYHVEIENTGKRTLQLMTRHWKITDREGRVQEVNGSGVVGQNPVLRPGARFEYTSGCPLNAPSGMMQGTYRFRRRDRRHARSAHSPLRARQPVRPARGRELRPQIVSVAGNR